MNSHTHPATTPAGERLLRLKGVIQKAGPCRSKIYELIETGQFPRPIKLGRMSLWQESAVDKWIADLIEANTCGQVGGKPRQRGALLTGSKNEGVTV